MHNFEFYWPVKSIVGQGEIRRTGIEARKLGKRALLVSGKASVKKTGVLDKVTASLKSEGVDYILYDEIEPNPRSTAIDKAGLLAKKEKCDLVIGLGGGSPMDSAKAIALMAKSPEGVSVWDYMFCSKNFRKIEAQPLPALLIPTLPATGSEGNPTSVITNWELHQKVHLMDNALFPKTAIIDPELIITLSNEQITYAGVDIVCHLLEPYLTTTGDAYVKDRMAEGVILTVMDLLPKALKDRKDIESLMNLSWSGTLACSPFRFMSWNGKGFLHWMEHCLSAWTDVPHSEGLSMLLPAWLKYMSRYKFFKYRLDMFGERMFGYEDSSVDTLIRWLDKVNAKRRLAKSYAPDIDRMAETLLAVYAGGKDFIELPSGERMVREDFAEIYNNALK
ncbi:MAG: iron-containing alcohol dehydrogenase [Candidatus Firestonebacteria bacterium]